MKLDKKERIVKAIKIITFGIFKIVLMIFAFLAGFFSAMLENTNK